MIVREKFESLLFTESIIGKVLVRDTDLIVSMKNIFVLSDHPLCGKNAGPFSGKFIFHNVFSSKKELTEYIGNPKKPEGFKEPYIVEDIPERLKGLENFNEYAFEGISDEPMAWVDWRVQAESFEFFSED